MYGGHDFEIGEKKKNWGGMLLKFFLFIISLNPKYADPKRLPDGGGGDDDDVAVVVVVLAPYKSSLFLP
jgi:hypothetical protein